MAVSFRNDYGVLAHPRYLEAIRRYEKQTHVPYGLDIHSHEAERLIRSVFGAEEADVHFLAGGTQTNLVLISYALRPYEAVISATTGHISVHESAAIEGTGHKVLAIEGKDGKLYPEAIRKCVALHPDEHTVKPKMVYISDSTETGTLYSKKELLDLRKVCDELNLLLYIDGARLGAALTADENDVEPSFLGKVADAFYIGGTKNGMLLGEALVLVNPDLKEDFRRHIKNRGAMLAKGYLIGIEFEEAFKDSFYFELSKKTNEMAALLKEGLLALGFVLGHSPTNQIFVSVPKPLAEALIEEFDCERWEEKENETLIRFVTSFATTEEDIRFAIKRIEELK